VAKKVRTPPPPRRVQAPKQRHTGGGGLTPERKRSILWGAGGAVAIALVVVLITVFTGGKSSSQAGNVANIRSALSAARCTVSTSPAAKDVTHITSFDEKLRYTTYPPVSGRHYYAPAIWGNYTQAVDPRQAVHNEQHGGVVIWVGPDVSPAERTKISDFYDESPNAMLVTPIEDTSKGTIYPKHAKPDSSVYLTAWTADFKNGNIVSETNVVANCPQFNEKAFTAFRDEFRGKGQERFPVSILTPGS